MTFDSTLSFDATIRDCYTGDHLSLHPKTCRKAFILTNTSGVDRTRLSKVVRLIMEKLPVSGMNKLEAVDTGALREELRKAPTAKAVKRLMIALAYADSVRVETLSDRYDIPRATVYSWLDRFEHQPISEAIEDDSRPGRPSKLSASQCAQLLDDLKESPAELGYDAPRLSPKLAQHHIEREYDVTYSLGHVRRLLRELPMD
jgi:transposase